MRATEGCINRYVAGRTTKEKQAEDRHAIAQMVIKRYRDFRKAGVPHQKDSMFEASSKQVLDRYIASLVSGPTWDGYSPSRGFKDAVKNEPKNITFEFFFVTLTHTEKFEVTNSLPTHTGPTHPTPHNSTASWN